MSRRLEKLLPTPPAFHADEHATHSLSQEFREIAGLCDQGPISFASIIERIRERGEALVILFLACPFLMPLPLPGLSIPFGVLIMIFGLALATGWQPFLPRRLLERQLPNETVKRFTLVASRILARTEKWFKPRWGHIVQNKILRSLSCALIILAGFMLALPLPPGTNAPPALSIVCLSLGLLQRDGLMLILGILAFCFNVVFFVLLAMFGYEAALKLMHLEVLWRQWMS